MKYTQRQWDREVGWGKVPKEYAHETKLEEYKRKINYDVWVDVSNVKCFTKGEEMSNPQFDSLWNPWNTSYKNITVNVNYTMKAKNYVQSQPSETTRTDNGNDKPKKVLRNTRGK
jgi:hypothetical protein